MLILKENVADKKKRSFFKITKSVNYFWSDMKDARIFYRKTGVFVQLLVHLTLEFSRLMPNSGEASAVGKIGAKRRHSAKKRLFSRAWTAPTTARGGGPCPRKHPVGAGHARDTEPPTLTGPCVISEHC
jgi:hypothetical protein